MHASDPAITTPRDDWATRHNLTGHDSASKGMVNFDDSNTPESVRHVSPNGIVNTIPIVRCLILPHLELPIVAEATTPIAYLMWTYFLHTYWSILGAFHVLHKLRPAHIKQFISPGNTLYLHRKGPCYVPIWSHHKILWQAEASMNTF